MSLVIVSWLLTQSFDRFLVTKSYLHSYFRFNITLKFLLLTFLNSFSLIAQESFGSQFFKDTDQSRSI